MKVSVNPAVKTQLLTVVAVSRGISLELAKKTHSDNIDRCIQNLETVEMGKCGIDGVLADPDSHIIILAKMIFQGLSMADAAISILLSVKRKSCEESNAPIGPMDECDFEDDEDEPVGKEVSQSKLRAIAKRDVQRVADGLLDEDPHKHNDF